MFVQSISKLQRREDGLITLAQCTRHGIFFLPIFPYLYITDTHEISLLYFIFFDSLAGVRFLTEVIEMSDLY